MRRVKAEEGTGMVGHMILNMFYQQHTIKTEHWPQVNEKYEVDDLDRDSLLFEPDAASRCENMEHIDACGAASSIALSNGSQHPSNVLDDGMAIDTYEDELFEPATADVESASDHGERPKATEA